ncbi:Phage integrase [Sphingopyxis sp. LC81]|uniref:site-specific integrase n=1 Tax=Sphingopyxis sp. LC81 TaxID=1502850 RepID=UPI00050F0433|nr:site-specific integrase [Sphingopyxis sp. LC81]KGB55030.1 Phage integrase [Sphingopyxis sp. LC81]
MSGKKRVPGYDYLYEVGRSLVVRVQVPSAVRSVLGKGELKKSFGRDHATAKSEYYRTVAVFKDTIKSARGAPANAAGSPIIHGVEPSLQEMEAASYDHFQRVMIHLRRKNVSPDGSAAISRKQRAEGFREMIDHFADVYDADQWQLMSFDVDGLCERQGWALEKLSAGYERMCRLMLRARLQAYKNELRLLEGSFSADPEADPLFDKEPPTRSNAPRNLGDLLERFKAARSLRWSASTSKNYIIIFRVIEEVCGRDTVLSAIDHDFCVKVRDQLRLIPANYKKMPALAEKPLSEVIRISAELRLAPISPATVNSHLNKLGAVIRYGRDQAWISGNPMADIEVPDPVAPEDKRDAFTIEQLRTLFAASPWNDPKHDITERPSRYWAPLVSLYSGARLTEICGQRVDEMVMENGVAFFDFRHRPDDRAMKNGKSRRVPVHPELIRLGFWGFVEAARVAEREMLFPDVKRHQLGKWGDGTSKWFSRKIDKLKLVGTNLSFHSLRHSFEDALKRVDLHDTPVGNAITGRWSAGVSKNYGTKYSLEKLTGALERVSYPGLVLIPREG